MFADTMSALVGVCRAPTSSLTAPPGSEASRAGPDHSGYFRYRVLCALGLVRGEWAPVNICSPSPANHNRAPGASTAAAILPQGHSGKSGSQKQVGLFTETWSLGCMLRPQGSNQVRTTQIKTGSFVSLNIAHTVSVVSLTHLQSATVAGLHKSERPRRARASLQLKVPNRVQFKNNQRQSALINEPIRC